MKKLAENADILHFHLPNPTAVMSYLIAGLNRKAVATYHSDIVRQRKLALFYRPFLKCFLNRIDRIIATSPNYVEFSNILSQYRLKCQVVPLGIPLSRFTSQADNQLKVELLIQEHGMRLVLFIGKFRYYKGLHVFIEAMKQVNGKLLMIGEGYLEEDLKKQVAANELDGKVTFLGELSDNEATAFLRACDIVVLPSVERSEAFGIVQLEAMACGKPVICTELGTGTTFINQHQKTGIVVEPNNPDALANAVNLLLDNPNLRKQYGQAGFNRVEKYFSVDRMINDLIAVYDTCLSN
jgi:rhamnosyl/mannosyltransferase